MDKTGDISQRVNLNSFSVLSDDYGSSGGPIILPFPNPLELANEIIYNLGVLINQIKMNLSKDEEKAEVVVISPESKDPIIFPINPNDFNPIGLNKVVRPGTKNGMIISWMIPLLKKEIFRWDENPNYSNGPHYHVEGSGHYIPGVDLVPEPYASIYFPYGS